MQRDELETGLELAPQKMKLKTKLLITAAALLTLNIYSGGKGSRRHHQRSAGRTAALGSGADNSGLLLYQYGPI